jgi:hypothetical protein
MLGEIVSDALAAVYFRAVWAHLGIAIAGTTYGAD